MHSRFWYADYLKIIVHNITLCVIYKIILYTIFPSKCSLFQVLIITAILWVKQILI